MAKSNTIRAILVNVNIIAILVSAYSLHVLLQKTEKMKEYINFGSVIVFVSFLVFSFIGCTGVWFKSKSFLQAQITINCVILVPKLILIVIFFHSYFYKKAATNTNNKICITLIVILLIGALQIFVNVRYLSILRKTDRASNVAVMQRSATPVYGQGSGIFMTFSPVMQTSSPPGVDNREHVTHLESFSSTIPGLVMSWVPAHVNYASQVNNSVAHI